MRKDLRALSLKRRREKSGFNPPTSHNRSQHTNSFQNSLQPIRKSNYLDSEIFGRNTIVTNNLIGTQNFGKQADSGLFNRFVDSRLQSRIIDGDDEDFMFEDDDPLNEDLDLDGDIFDDDWHDQSQQSILLLFLFLKF